MPGLEVTFAQMGVRYTGEIEVITVDLGDSTNHRPATHPIAINVRNTRQAQT